MRSTITSILIASATLALASPAPAPSAQKASTNAQCGTISGVQYTCQGSAFGNCCSPSGWCGSSTTYCGAGCQSTFGSCGSSTTTTTSPAVSTTTASSTPTASDAPNGIPPPVCAPTSPQLLQNPSFEDGSTSWTLSAGAQVISNGQDTTYSLSGSAGKKYLQLAVSGANPTSSALQTLTRIAGPSRIATVQWDYCFGAAAGPDTGLAGQPKGTCMLEATLSSGGPGGLTTYSLGKWTRSAKVGGCGRETASLVQSLRSGDVKFEFSCDPAPGSGGGSFAVAVDNVKFLACEGGANAE